MTIEDLRAYGADVNEGVARCMNNEAFYLRLVGMLAADTHDSALKEAIAAGDLQAAFEAAHALKGALANLALKPALAAVEAILEPLRAKEDRDDYPSLAQAVSDEMTNLKALISR
ncbi:MAG: Hpt domain-containing protein [Clostridia bacterium]|nr:Hpt domain-containing protein [Clostridia bacterium]